MAHIGRSVKNVEAPRPLKSQSRSSLKNNFMLIEELIQLIENVAISLQSGINNTEPMATLVQNLRIHGPQLETVSKDTLDRAFVVFRNASQDERLNIMTRLNLLELIELRAKGWEDNGINSYYKTKQATNAELNDVQNHVDPTQTAFLSTSPTFGGVNAGGNAAAAAVAAAIASVGSANQQHLLLSPGEVIRNSGKFPKPTKIPGKTYCKDEVVIRNADSGKVNPGAKERLVQITGPAEDKINYAKQLIEDTIRRNASPVRLDPAMGSSHAGGSCSSLASSNSDEPVQPRTPGASSNLSNRLSFNSAQNFMTAAAASQQMVQHQPHQQPQHMPNIPGMNTSTPVANAVVAAAAAGKPIRPHSQMLLHSYSTNDASLGEYKFTCNVGQHVIKITGDCCDLVRVAKLVLDDYFSSAEFLASIEAGAAFDGSMASPITTPTTPMSGAPQFAMGNPLHAASPLATDSGIGLNYMSSVSGNNQDIDDDVFVDGNNLSKSASQSNGLARSRRSHFSRKDSTPEAAANNLATTAVMRQKSEPGGNNDSNTITETSRIVHQYEHLLYYAKSPHSWALPTEWEKIRKQFPAIIRNKVKTTSATTHASTTATTTPSTLTTTPSYSSTNTTTKASSLTLRVACNNAAAHTTCLTNMTTTTTNTTTTSTITNATSSCLIKTLDTNLINFTHNSTIPPPSSTSTTSVTNNISVNNNNNNNSLSNNYNNYQQHHHQYHQQQQQYPNNNLNYNESHVNGKSLETSTTTSSSTAYKLNTHANLSLNIRRKGFFNRLTYSIDEDGYEAAMKTPSPIVEAPPPPAIQSNIPPTNHHLHASHTHNVSNVTAGSGRIHSAGLHTRHSIRSGPMTSMAISPLSSMGNGGSGGSDHYYHHHHQHHQHHHHSPNEAHTRQKLLNKQIKIISDIMVESSKSSATNKSNENLKSNYDYQQHKINQDIDNVVADDDDDDVEIVAISPATTTPQVAIDAEISNSTGSNSYMRPKLNYEFRSYSTCD